MVVFIAGFVAPCDMGEMVRHGVRQYGNRLKIMASQTDVLTLAG